MAKGPPATIEDLLARYAAGERHFAEAELDFAHADLTGVKLDGADLSKSWFLASFRGASLREVSFRGANMKTCDFSGADLTDADFRESALESTEFSGAILTRARFGGAHIYSYVMQDDEQPDW